MTRRSATLAFLESRAALAAVATLVIALATAAVGEATVATGGGTGPPIWNWIGRGIGAVLAIEWLARVLLAPSHRRAPSGAILDGLAAIPLIVPHAVFPAIILLYLLRLWTFVRRLLRALAPMRRGTRTLAYALGLVVTTLTFGTAALLLFEVRQAPGVAGAGRALWFSLDAIFAQEPSDQGPRSLGGQLATAAMMFTGLGTFAVLTGTVSALVSERIRSPEVSVEWDDLRDHLIICGWSRKAEVVASEFRANLTRTKTAAARAQLDMPIVVLAELEHPPALTDPSLKGHVQFLNDDFTKVAALEKAGVRRASRVVLLSDTTRGRRERDADARTILAALTIEKLNHEVYTCAEINRREYGAHLEMGNVNDYVVSGEHSAFLLAQAAMNRGMVGLFTELFTCNEGNRFTRAQLTSEWQGKTFDQLMIHVKEAHGAILVAVQRADGQMIINPQGYALRGDEEVVAIATSSDFVIGSPPRAVIAAHV